MAHKSAYARLANSSRLNRAPRPHLLRQLANHLEKNVPLAEFDQDNWCGTARCAMGHAPSVKAIADQGLRIDPFLNLTLSPQVEDEFSDSDLICGDLDNYERAQWVFGITEKESHRCFGVEGNTSMEAVIKRIRQVARRYDRKGV